MMGRTYPSGDVVTLIQPLCGRGNFGGEKGVTATDFGLQNFSRLCRLYRIGRRASKRDRGRKMPRTPSGLSASVATAHLRLSDSCYAFLEPRLWANKRLRVAAEGNFSPGRPTGIAAGTVSEPYWFRALLRIRRHSDEHVNFCFFFSRRLQTTQSRRYFLPLGYGHRRQTRPGFCRPSWTRSNSPSHTTHVSETRSGWEK